MRKRLRTGLWSTALLGGILAMGIAWLGLDYSSRQHYVAAIPAEIEISHVIDCGSDTDMISLMLPIRHESCGAAVFKLTTREMAELGSEGIETLHSAFDGRGYPEGSRNRHYYTYKGWHLATAEDFNDQNNLLSFALSCNRGSWLGLDNRILKAAQSTPTFIATKDEAKLYVIPSEGIAVLAWFG